MTHLNVAVRVRPLSERETEVKAVPVVEIFNNNVIAVTNLKVLEHNAGDSRERVRRFSFDHCFDKSTTQEQVFEAIENVIGGAIRKKYHTCVLAYGQSSSGKTHTIMGVDDDPGLTPRLCESVFNYIHEVDVEEEAKSITVSYLEIYNEKVKDLLSFGNHQSSLKVREHPNKGTYVQGLSHHPVTDPITLLERLQTGNKKRRVSATSVNHQSSRSHSVFTITCFGGVKLTLVDLAGSERTGSRNFNNTSTFREGANINKSLVALGNVIFALADQSKSSRRRYVPYRDSVLTWLLKDTLGGNSKTVMIATISPSHTCYNETVNTLRFGHRAKQIIAQPVSNEDPKQKTIRDLKTEVAKLKELLLKNEIDPHLQFRTLGNCEVATLKTIDQSTNTDESSLDENLQLTRKILDGILEQIKAKLKDDFRWCKEELLRTSNGDGVFGEIIKNSFGKKLVCKEYPKNTTQIYNIPEFKVFVYSDGKNIPSITEGVPITQIIGQNTSENPNVISESLTTNDQIQDVVKGGSIIDEVGQNTSKVVSNLESSNEVVANITPVTKVATSTALVSQEVIADISSVFCNQLVNEDFIKIDQNISNNTTSGTFSESITASVKENADTIENCISGIPVVQGVLLVNEKVGQNSPKSIINVNLSGKKVTTADPIREGVTNSVSAVQDIEKLDTNTVLADRSTANVQLVNENGTKANQNTLKFISDVDSFSKEVTSAREINQGVTNINSVAQNIPEGDAISVTANRDVINTYSVAPNNIKGGITSISINQDVNNIDSVAQNIAKVDATSVLVSQGVTNIKSVAQDDIKRGVTSVAIKQNATSFKFGNINAAKVDQGNLKGIPYVNLRAIGVGVNDPSDTNIDSLIQDVTKDNIKRNNTSNQLFNVSKLDQNRPRSIPYSDLSKKGIIQGGLTTRGVTNINLPIQDVARGCIKPRNVTEGAFLKDLEGSKLNTPAKKLDLKVLRAATAKLIPVMDVSSAISSSEKPAVKLRRTFSVCSAEMESKKTKMYGSYETLSKYQQPEPQLRKRSLDKSTSSVRNLKDKASTESVPEKVKSANDVSKSFSKVEAKVDSIRKTPKPRAEIVAAVTQRLYAKIKKKEVATETDDIIKEHKGTLARIRLQDITQRALRACRRRHAESQTETLPILRVKETGTDVQDLKVEAAEMKHAHVSTQEVITKDAGINHTQDITFDQPLGRQSLVLTKSCGIQVSSSSPTANKEDQQHLLSFTKYLRPQKEPKIEVSHRATANPIYTSSVNINVSHNYINRKDSLSGDSLEDQNNTNAISLPTPDLISNHNSLEAEKANQVESLGLPQTCVVKEEHCRSLPNYQPKMYKLRVTETKPHETSFSIEQPAILKSIVKQSNDPEPSDCDSDNSSTHAFDNVPDSLNYHINKSVRFDEEPMNGRILEVMTNFLKEATTLMTNLAAAATNRLDVDQAYDLQVTVSDAGNIINRKPRRRQRRRRPRKNETGSQTCSSYENAVSQTSPKKTSEKCVETDGEIPENKYEFLVRKACDRLERCADAISTDWYSPAHPEDSSMESNVTFSDYGSLPRQKLKYKPSCSPKAFLKELTTMRKQIIDSSREELVGESHG